MLFGLNFNFLLLIPSYGLELINIKFESQLQNYLPDFRHGYPVRDTSNSNILSNIPNSTI